MSSAETCARCRCRSRVVDTRPSAEKALAVLEGYAT
jgi:hypothetical protein